MEHALKVITEAACEISESNALIDFEEFLDILQDDRINIDHDDDNNNYNKSNLSQYFCALLKILKCDHDIDSNELNIQLFLQYINKTQHINSFTTYANARMELSAFNYMRYLIDSVLHQNKKNKNKHRQKCKHKKRNDVLSTEKLLLITEELTEYLEDGESTMDYQDFIGWCREFVPNQYPQNHIQLSFEFIVKQHEKHLDKFEIDEIEISASVFVAIIAKYGDNKHEQIGDIITNVFDVLSAIQLKHKQSQLIQNLRCNLHKADNKQCGMITLDEFISGLKASNVKYISKRDMKKIFTMSTTNGSMKINLFMERFTSNGSAMDVDGLFLNAFEGIVSKKKKRKKKKKKKKCAKQNTEIETVSATELSQIAECEDKSSKLQDGFSELQFAFATIDDNYINFSEFMAVIVGDLKLNLSESECKQIYFHQPLCLIKGVHYLDLSDLMDQLFEEYLSFPEGTAGDLLRRYFSKILQEAAPFERLNEFILDYMQSENKSIHNEIISSYGTKSSAPLLRRVHKRQRFDCTILHRGRLERSCTPTILEKVIKSIRSDSTLQKAEITQMHENWCTALKRQNHKFTDLMHLNFCLFHLSLIVSSKLVKRLRARETLKIVYENEEINIRQCATTYLQEKETEEKKDIDDYQQSKQEIVNKIASELNNVEFKLIDLILEFIGDDDNTI